MTASAGSYPRRPRAESWSTDRSRYCLTPGASWSAPAAAASRPPPDGKGGLRGVEAVVDKDSASALLARDLDADLLVLATDTPAAYLGFGTDHQRAVSSAHPDAILAEQQCEFAAGSMLPKITAACEFARQTHNPAVIGQLADIEALVAGTAGTTLTNVSGVGTTP